MKIISHRANLFGPDKENENKKEQILRVINEYNFDVEIDLWFENNSLYLGHDQPETIINLNFLERFKENLWIHCKNLDAIDFLSKQKTKNFNFFYHEIDKLTLTSKGFLWVYPGIRSIDNCISVLPEKFPKNKISNCFGICTDYPSEYQKNEK